MSDRNALQRPDVGLSHVALVVADLEASARFYARFARLEVVHRRGAPGHGVAWLSAADEDNGWRADTVAGESGLADFTSPELRKLLTDKLAGAEFDAAYAFALGLPADSRGRVVSPGAWIGHRSDHFSWVLQAHGASAAPVAGPTVRHEPPQESRCVKGSDRAAYMCCPATHASMC